MSARSLPARANLEFLRKESKDLRRDVAAGDAAALQRVHDHLPKARQLSDEALRELDLSLQEAQHVLACEYGFGKWQELLVAVEPLRFEDLGELPDGTTRALLRKTEQRDLVCALVGAPEPVVQRLLSTMSRRVRDFIRSEMVFLGTPEEDVVEAARQRILDHVLWMREQGWITWPPFRQTAALPTGPGRYYESLNRLSTPLMELTPEELVELLVGAAEQARREGILSLEQHLGEGGTLLTEGLQLAVDGTRPDLLQDLMERRAETILRGRTQRIYLAIEGWMSILSGDNPAIVQEKMESIYVEDPVIPDFATEVPPTDELVQRLRASAPACSTPAGMVPFYRDLATLRRLQGLTALLPLVDVLDDPILLTGMRTGVEETRTPDEVMAALEVAAQELRLQLHRRHQMAIHGVLGIQAGDNPKFVEEKVHAAGEQGVAKLAAQGLPGYV